MLDRVKESVFNILASKTRGAAVLDIYAGSGSLGVEALSRGARRAVFVESSKAACEVITKNLERCGLQEMAEVKCASLPRALSVCPGQYDLIFVDPPFRIAEGELVSVLEAVARCLAEDGTVILQTVSSRAVPELAGLRVDDVRQYGQSVITLLKRAS